MKKLIFTAVAVFGFISLQAQENQLNEGFSKGDVFTTGSFGFSSSKQGNVKSTNINFSPSVGYFLTENVALGGRLNFSNNKVEATLGEFNSSGFGAEVFGRYYFTPASKFSVFGELAAGIGNSKNEDAFGNENKTKSYGINAGLGLHYFLNSNFAIQAGWTGLGYNSSKPDISGADSTNTFNFSLNMSTINFGLLYKF